MINQEDAGDWAIRGVAIAIVTFACFLHGTWRAGGIYLNNILATLKVGVLLVIIGAGMAAYGGAFETKPGEKLVDAFEVEDKAFPKSDYGTYGYAESFLSVMFSYGGFMNANYVRPPFCFDFNIL